ncbi:MAG TPA: hypothetical protein VFH26_08155, partial [Gemmatimonadales bacterium]|nr:hypothetical protein [Gemmatimonadales bacterium]
RSSAMKWTRRFMILGLALALSATVSCSTADAPTGPAVQTAEQQQQEYLLGNLFEGDGLLSDGGLLSGDGLVGGILDGAVSTVLNVSDLLVCSSQPYQVARKTIGYDGGTIQVGTHTLVIPRGALRRQTTITAEQMPGRTNSIRFSPEGLQFERPAGLVMNYRNCLVVLLKKKIVYTDEQLKVLEVLRSLDLFGSRTVTAPIDHFSRYAIAY